MQDSLSWGLGHLLGPEFHSNSLERKVTRDEGLEIKSIDKCFLCKCITVDIEAFLECEQPVLVGVHMTFCPLIDPWEGKLAFKLLKKMNDVGVSLLVLEQKEGHISVLDYTHVIT